MTRPIYVGSEYIGQCSGDLKTFVKSRFNSLPDNAVISVIEGHVYVSIGQLCDDLEFSAKNYFWSMIN